MLEQKWVYEVRKENLVFSDDTGKWCRIPYYNHPTGCPNYNRVGCPPKAALLKDLLDYDWPVYLIHSNFPLLAHMRKMRNLHPDWSIHMQRNVLYWQGTSRKQLRERVKRFIDILQDKPTMISYCPEGRGLNVYATAQKVGLYLERIRHLKTCKHVAIVGTFKKGIIDGSE